jgi:hypothetical protein
MDYQQGNRGDSNEPYTATVGPAGSEKLIFAETEHYLQDESLQIATADYVELEDWR